MIRLRHYQANEMKVANTLAINVCAGFSTADTGPQLQMAQRILKMAPPDCLR